MKEFPNIIPASIFLVNIPNDYWLSGFSRALGFMVGIAKSALSSTGYRVYLAFIITQHIRDELLMKLNYLDCKLRKIKKIPYPWWES